MVTASSLVEYRLNKMVAMKYLFRKDLALVVKIIDTNTMAVLREDDIDVTIGRIAVKLALNIVSQSGMAVAQGHRLTAQKIIKAT